MEEIIRIKPCPFCGNKDTDKIKIQNVTGIMQVECLVCKAAGPLAKDFYDVVDAWNSRQVIILPKDAYEKAMKELEDESNRKD